MSYRRAVLLVIVITMALASPAHSATDQAKLRKLIRETGPRFGTVFSTAAVSEALQKAKTSCVCFDAELNAARVGFVVFTGPQSAGEGFTSLCLTPVFASDGSVAAGTGACADFTPFATPSTP
jgi:hypothetical protein